MWFGVQAVLNPLVQLTWMSEWVRALPLIGTKNFIFAFGIFEILLGLFLIAGLYVKMASLLAVFALASIIINLGFNDVSLRDLVILFGALILVFEPNHKWTFLTFHKKPIEQ